MINVCHWNKCMYLFIVTTTYLIPSQIRLHVLHDRLDLRVHLGNHRHLDRPGIRRDL